MCKWFLSVSTGNDIGLTEMENWKNEELRLTTMTFHEVGSSLQFSIAQRKNSAVTTYTAVIMPFCLGFQLICLPYKKFIIQTGTSQKRRDFGV